MTYTSMISLNTSTTLHQSCLCKFSAASWSRLLPLIYSFSPLIRFLLFTVSFWPGRFVQLFNFTLDRNIQSFALVSFLAPLYSLCPTPNNSGTVCFLNLHGHQVFFFFIQVQTLLHLPSKKFPSYKHFPTSHFSMARSLSRNGAFCFCI